MSREMTHTVTAERSSVNKIMQVAIKWEKGNGAYTYYAKTKASCNAQPSSSTNESGNRNNMSSRPETHNTNRRPRSSKQLQIVDQCRYTVKAHTTPKGESMCPPRHPKTPDPAPELNHWVFVGIVGSLDTINVIQFVKPKENPPMDEFSEWSIRKATHRLYAYSKCQLKNMLWVKK
ncbi:hypothetical protein GYMLUDRAFT_55741 [Collybiopsis luxurians FD-317 M1]|nr:hypothetical protein GYMLUDRAFT_55741 [Collybiopsis luxurians FD-317 M1]